MNMRELITQIQATPDCQVFAPVGMPIIREGHLFPEDLRSFYTLCGGVRLFKGRDYAVTLVSPRQFVAANPVIVGDVVEDDISSTWYIIADDGNGEYLTIDLSRERLGRCYDSFFDCHAVAGSCPIIAPSFTDLLMHLYENQGQYWYWLRPNFTPIGDAYADNDNET
jgi:hypothetical protein